jgi:regulator of protease activity HflC (stomatin/prohibitin superfamily)
MRDIAVWRRRASGSGRVAAIGLAALFVLVTLFGTLCQVQPEEVGVVVRFGQYIRTAKPGLRVKFALIEEVFRMPVQVLIRGGCHVRPETRVAVCQTTRKNRQRRSCWSEEIIRPAALSLRHDSCAS